MYVYNADTYCDSCGERIIAEIKRAAKELDGLDTKYVPSLDSSDYPQYADEESTDYPDHCASGVDCLEPLDLFDYGLTTSSTLYGAESTHIGALLSDGLTDAGVNYLREMIDPAPLHYTRGIGSGATHTYRPTPYQRALHAYWREVFADELARAEV